MGDVRDGMRGVGLEIVDLSDAGRAALDVLIARPAARGAEEVERVQLGDVADLRTAWQPEVATGFAGPARGCLSCSSSPHLCCDSSSRLGLHERASPIPGETSGRGYERFLYRRGVRGLLILLLPTVAWSVCAPDDVRFDSHDLAYRAPFGAVSTGTPVRLRVEAEGFASARVRVWDAVARAERWFPMRLEAGAFRAEVSADRPNILYYLFELTPEDGGDPCYVLDDDPGFTGGGPGVPGAELDTLRSFQLTVYDPPTLPETWLGEAVVYQIFVDRFRDGDRANSPDTPRFYYGRDEGTTWRSGGEAWNSRVCDPTETREPACRGVSSSNFYGGDLVGITEKVEAGYFDALGVTALYLTPVFDAPSNHKYDTTDYLAVDPDFGTQADLEALFRALRARDMRLVLDGVFNHVSSDSPYFDGFGRYDEVGACEAEDSPFRDWFYLPDIGSPGRAGGRPIECAGGATYEAWFGFGALPKLRADHPEVRRLVWQVANHWSGAGAAGWRLDVAGDIDNGKAGEPGNDFWETFRAQVRGHHGDVVVIGEEWGDASRWLLGDEWDSAMNYRLRSALLGWMAEREVVTNDENDASSSGPIRPLSPSAFHARLMSIHEDYPPAAWRSMLNLVGSHDTNRIRFLVEESGGGARWRQLWTFLFSYPGAPMVYYGDEVGASEDGVFTGGTWRDDPFNRLPFPWGDAPGHYEASPEWAAEVRRLAALRWSHPALVRGDIEHGWLLDDARGVYGFRRSLGEAEAVVVLNRGAEDVELQVELVDPFAPGRVVAAGGARVFATPGDTIAAPAEVSADAVGDGTITWTPVRTDTHGEREVALAYEVLLDGEVHARVEPPAFGGPLTARVEVAGEVAVRAVGVWGPGAATPLGGVAPEVDAGAVADAGTPGLDGALPPPQDAGRVAAADAGHDVEIDGGREGCGQAPSSGDPGWWALVFAGARRRRYHRRAEGRHRGEG